MIKERPILFSAPMVRALLDGSKTQTRRLYKARKHPDFGCEMAAFELAGSPQHVIDRMCPYGQPGDCLWVRETWRAFKLPKSHPEDEEVIEVDYRATPESWSFFGRNAQWKPSIHMPRWASRILLEVVSVRIERLQEISEADAKAEGIEPHEVRQFMIYGTSPAERAAIYRDAAVGPYRGLWQQINGADSWDANPWVWVVEFKHVKEFP